MIIFLCQLLPINNPLIIRCEIFKKSTKVYNFHMLKQNSINKVIVHIFHLHVAFYVQICVNGGHIRGGGGGRIWAVVSYKSLI